MAYSLQNKNDRTDFIVLEQEEHATRITARWGVQRARLPTDGGGVVVERDSDCRTNKPSQRHQMMELVP
ncbi:hypothetical protein NHJ13734_004059 [Beauveria thailandica]